MFFAMLFRARAHAPCVTMWLSFISLARTRRTSRIAAAPPGLEPCGFRSEDVAWSGQHFRKLWPKMHAAKLSAAFAHEAIRGPCRLCRCCPGRSAGSTSRQADGLTDAKVQLNTQTQAISINKSSGSIVAVCAIRS